MKGKTGGVDSLEEEEYWSVRVLGEIKGSEGEEGEVEKVCK